MSRHDVLVVRRAAVLGSWAYAVKNRDVDLARIHAEHIQELDTDIYYEGGGKLDILDLTAALSGVSIPWYNDVCRDMCAESEE